MRLDIATMCLKGSDFISWTRMVLCNAVKLFGALYRPVGLMLLILTF